MKLLQTLLLFGCCYVTAPIILADPIQAVHVGKSVSKEQVIELLAPGSRAPLKTRGIHVSMPTGEKPAPRALSLEVFFDFDSATLTPTAREQLHPVGEALRSNELSRVSFTLEGHTDAAGSEIYNLDLSQRRAESVKQFLVGEFQLTPERVSTMGKGESELLDNANPNSGVNRRVTIIAE